MNPDAGRLTGWLWPPLMSDSEDGAGGGGDAGAQGAGGEDPGSPVSTGGGQDEEEGGGSAEPDVESPWRLEDVPEEFRAEAERLDRHWKSHHTRKLAELREQTVDPELRTLLSRLEDPEDGARALDELAERFDFAPIEEPGSSGEIEDEYSHLDPKLADRLRKQDQIEERRSQAEKAADRDRQVSVLREHVEAGMEPLRKGLPEGQKLSQEVVQAYTHHALGHPLPGGLPDTDGAVAAIQKIEADAVARFKASLNGKPEPPAVQGGSGVQQHDHSTDAGRRAHAEQVAARHYVRD